MTLGNGDLPDGRESLSYSTKTRSCCCCRLHLPTRYYRYRLELVSLPSSPRHVRPLCSPRGIQAHRRRIAPPSALHLRHRRHIPPRSLLRPGCRTGQPARHGDLQGAKNSGGWLLVRYGLPLPPHANHQLAQAGDGEIDWALTDALALPQPSATRR